MKKCKKTLSLSLASSLFIFACTTPAKSRLEESSGPVQLGNSSVSIEYILGRDHYRFTARSEETRVTGTTYLDKQLLKKGEIDQQRYPGFFTRASEIVDNLSRAPASDTFCRNPFIITIKAQEKTRTARGCRSSDDGALSKLIREGEFLLYSKK
ncbi:MAG: hypothetical protein HYX41_02745 [Bdellovibrio sp.]|nr:hypothetical protein [Bdellovibrio sp.]